LLQEPMKGLAGFHNLLQPVQCRTEEPFELLAFR
jgi:hypothetical protein